MSKKMRGMAALVLVVTLTLAGCQLFERQPEYETQAVTKMRALMLDNYMDQIVFQVQGHSTQTSSLLVLEQSDGTDVLTVSNAGVINAVGGQSNTLSATGKVLLDADTTNHTDTAGVLDINVGTVTADVSAINVAMTTDDGTATGTDVFGAVMTLTQNDADADLFGIKITAAATANAAAGGYEYLIGLDCAENTAGACPDGILVTSSGANTAMTDGLDVSADNIVNAVNVGSNQVLGGNSDYFTIGATDASFIVTRDNAGAVTFAGADNSGPADTIYDTTGAGTVTVGSADVTAITLSTDGSGTAEVVLPAGSIDTDEVLDNTLTFADVSNSSAVDADTVFTMGDGIELVLQPSYTSGDTEALLIDVNQVDDDAGTDDVYAILIAATSESDDAGDTFRGIGINWEDGTANTIMDAAIAIDNEEDTAATMTDAIIVTSSGAVAGVTDAIDVSASNILNAINLGDNDVVVGTQFNLKNSSTGSVIVNFRDYADTTDDDMAHAVLTANCTDTGTGAEDCDFTIGVVEGGAAAETRFNVDADAGITIGSANSSSVLLTSGTANATFSEPAAAGSGGNIWDITATFGAMNGADTSIGVALNLTGANAAGTGNLLYGLDIDLTTPDPQVTEKALDLNDADWDYAIDAGHVPIVSTAATFMDDFFGGTIQTWWTEVSGTDPQAVQAIQANAQYGEYQITSGDDNTGCAESCEGIVLGLHWSVDQGSLVFETRLHIDTAVASEVICVGLTDNAALEMPVTIGAGNVRTWVADDAVVVCYDDAAETDEWWFLSRDGVAGAEGTGAAATGVAPVADVYQVIRIEIDAGGEDARCYVDGVLVGTITANAITVTDLLTPIVIVDTNAAESNVVDLDYVFVSAQRR